MPVSEFPVQKEYEKNPNMKSGDIREIRDWLNKQLHLPHEHITDLDIILAYHSCNCDKKVTKQVVDLNYTLKTLCSFYQDRIPDNLETAFHTWLITTLSTPTSKGNRIIYCQLLEPDVNKFVYIDAVRAFLMVMDLWQYEEGTVPGVAIVMNMDKVSLGHISRIDLTVAQQYLYFLQNAMFIPLKEFHFINAPSFIDKFLSMIKPFMKKEFLDMLKVHQTGSLTLNEYIPKAVLPEKAADENNDIIILRDEAWNKIKDNKEFFVEESKKRVYELKRPGGPKSITSFFSGLEETFKKLEID